MDENCKHGATSMRSDDKICSDLSLPLQLWNPNILFSLTSSTSPMINFFTSINVDVLFDYIACPNYLFIHILLLLI